MKILLSMTSLALLFVLANCDKKKEGDMPATEATSTQEAPAADSSSSTEETTEESKE